MKVILIKDVVKIGNKDSVLEFADGYAQNVLIAKGLAIRATPHELSKLEDRKKKLTAQKDEDNRAFDTLILSLSKNVLDIKVNSNDKGHLFSAIQKNTIKQKIFENLGIEIDEANIILPKPIKEVGTHMVMIKKGDREGEFKVNIT